MSMKLRKRCRSAETAAAMDNFDTVAYAWEMAITCILTALGAPDDHTR